MLGDHYARPGEDEEGGAKPSGPLWRDRRHYLTRWSLARYHPRSLENCDNLVPKGPRHTKNSTRGEFTIRSEFTTRSDSLLRKKVNHYTLN